MNIAIMVDKSNQNGSIAGRKNMEIHKLLKQWTCISQNSKCIYKSIINEFSAIYFVEYYKFRIVSTTWKMY